MTMASILTNEYYRNHPLPFADNLLENCVVVISGGGSGIGKAAAWQAARLGAKVAICARNSDRLLAVSNAINDAGFHCDHKNLDIRNREQVDDFLGGVFRRHGKVDILINSAGGQFAQNAADFSEKGWASVVETNLTGTFNMMQAAARRWLAEQVKGSIVNVTFSPHGLHQMAHSVAARCGVMGFSEAVAVEWAPNIKVNCVAPGTVASDHFTLEEKRLYSQTNPMLDTGAPWDLAAACLFIGGPLSPFITGQTLHINGGANLWGESWPLGKPAKLCSATAVWGDEGESAKDRYVAEKRFQR